MGLNLTSRHSLVPTPASSASLVPGLSLCIVRAVRKMALLSWNAPANMISMKRFRVTASRVSLPLFCGVLPMVRLTYFLAHKACLATSLHFLARMLSFLIGLLKAKPCLSRCRWKSGSALETTLGFGSSLSTMFHVKHLILDP